MTAAQTRGRRSPGRITNQRIAPARRAINCTRKLGGNQFTILCDRHHLNELGTGGLIGPAVRYREKPAKDTGCPA